MAENEFQIRNPLKKLEEMTYFLLYYALNIL